MKVNVHKVTESAKKHSGTICAAVAVVGTITTAIFSGFGAIKCHDEIEPEMTAKEKAKVIFKAHWKSGVSGAITIGAIIASDRIHVTNELALAGAAYAYKDKLVTFKDKMKELVGEDAVKEVEEEIKAETANEKLNDIPEDIKLSAGEFIVYVAAAEQFYITTERKKRDAIYELNEELHKVHDVRMSFFTRKLGRPMPDKNGKIHYNPTLDDIGWRLDNAEQHYEWENTGYQWVDYIPNVFIRKTDLGSKVTLSNYLKVDEPIRDGDVRAIMFTIEPDYQWMDKRL